MGPMVPLLALIPVFLGAGWLFRTIAVVRGIPLITTGCVLATLAIVGFYLYHFHRFARKDPDRLQSEEYRFGMARMHMIAAKDLPYAIPADRLSLAEPTENPIQHEPQTQEEKSSDSEVAEEEKAQ